MTTSHSFSAPGTYTVTSMVMNDGGTDSESCLVTVVAPPMDGAPKLSIHRVGVGRCAAATLAGLLRGRLACDRPTRAVSG